ncbi:MAG: two-component system response regulator [Rhizobiaceae bacterium]|nr:two-component system response regulator [Rhizobiaceae bacterium]
MTARSLKILIADDHHIIRTGIRAILEARTGWHVCAEADNGEDAVKLVLSHLPDIAILDYSLPVLNGLEAARKVIAGSPKTQVLMYTMHEDEMLIRDALKVWARGYLLKSEDDAKLLAAVEALEKGRPYFSQRVTECLLDDFLNAEKAFASQTLTSREREVVQLVAEGQSNKNIAARWGVSMKTVDSHRTSAMKKLNLRSAVDLTRYAIRNRLIEP